ncbi:MAG: AAA family ATPase [Dehalococcoidales bacterium]|nr:AAA family ATPase [Dehalococcoidales bacterium]
MKIIGAVGQNGSGKDEVLKYLKSAYNVPFLSTGDIVRSIAAKEGAEPTRENLGKISSRYFDEFGKGCFVKMLADKLKQSGWPVAGITGIRSLDDVTILKNIFGKNFILFRVYVTDPQLRFARMVKRAEGRDPVSYEQFSQQEDYEEKLFRISEAENQADYSLSNDTSLADLHRQIDEIVSKNGILNA